VIGGKPDIQITDKMKCNAERQVMVSLARIESQRRYRKSSVRAYDAHADYQSAFDRLSYFAQDEEEIFLWMKLIAHRTRNTIESPIWWTVIQKFAKIILVKRCMTGKETESAIKKSLVLYP
jgi:hypothetical protein